MALYPTAAMPAPRRQSLHDGLPATVDLLKQRRAADIDEGALDDYVALHWLEWNGGTLRLTVTGQNICRQLSTGVA